MSYQHSPRKSSSGGRNGGPRWFLVSAGGGCCRRPRPAGSARAAAARNRARPAPRRAGARPRAPRLIAVGATSARPKNSAEAMSPLCSAATSPRIVEFVAADAAATAAMEPEIAAAVAPDRAEQPLERGERVALVGPAVGELEAAAQRRHVALALEPLAHRPEHQLLAHRELGDAGRLGREGCHHGQVPMRAPTSPLRPSSQPSSARQRSTSWAR